MATITNSNQVAGGRSILNSNLQLQNSGFKFSIYAMAVIARVSRYVVPRFYSVNSGNVAGEILYFGAV